MNLESSPIERFKAPEYTGENRCMPCTVVNGFIAVVGGAVITAAVVYGTGSVPAAIGTGALFVLVSAVVIYLRGYLVPGTPELTKRYLPPWILERFGKQPAASQPQGDPTDIDPEAVLMESGALEECQGGEELCLVPDFQRDWTAAVEDLSQDETDRAVLVDVLNIDDLGEFVEYGDAVQLRIGGRTAGTWESKAAVLADAAAAKTLGQYDDAWPRRSTGQRAMLLKSLRLFLENCPACGETLTFGGETVESCCSTHEIYALECAGCDARLFESRPMG